MWFIQINEGKINHTYYLLKITLDITEIEEISHNEMLNMRKTRKEKKNANFHAIILFHFTMLQQHDHTFVLFFNCIALQNHSNRL